MSRALCRSIFDFLVPRECPACRTGHEAKQACCPNCEQELKKLATAPRCVRCAMPLTIPNAPCAHCGGDGLRPFEQIVCSGLLNDPLKTLIHRAKYEHRWILVEQLADRVFDQLDTRALLADSDIIVPVPLHRKRQIQRGYNQADVIARRICRQRRVSHGTSPRVRNAAVRVVNTQTQTHLRSRAQREENLKGAFVLIDPAAIAGKHIVLVDDVLTTGATLISLARTLQPAKPARLSAIVLAVADPKGRAFEVI